MQVTFENCGKSYNRHWLFRHVNCSFHSGEKWAFLGSNGSGKTTLTMLLTSQVWPTEGKIIWKEKELMIEPSKVFSVIALASPAMELPEEFNLIEIVSMHSGSKPFLVPEPLDTLAALCGFDSKTLNKPVTNFSSGMKQRVKLCLAALSDTPVLILDEPLTNLDKAGAQVFETILEIYTNNRLLVIASNREEEYHACNRFIRLDSEGVAHIENPSAI